MIKSPVIAFASFLAFGVSTAQAGTPLVNARQANQAHRIFNGVANGSLTFAETRSLVRGQARVARIEARAKSDGIVTPWERTRLYAAQGVQSVRIFSKKHN
jgi:hypothetical protein